MLSQFWPVRLAREKAGKLGPGSRKFVKSLSVVTICFAISKVFSSVATVVVARYLGAFSFGEASLVLLMAQMVSLFMLSGLHVSLMKYGSSEDNPAEKTAAATYLIALNSVVVGTLVWFAREPLMSWLGLTEYKITWAIAIAVMFSAYAIFTSIYQTLNLFKQRGFVEIFFAFLLLPGLFVGHLLTGGNYDTILIAYAVAYCVSIPIIGWRFRHLLSPKNLFKRAGVRELVIYGYLSCLSNFGFFATYLIQPFQLEWERGETDVGIFRVYCQGSINLAAFATSIFFAVFFPKVSASKDRSGIWRMLSKAWLRAALPLLIFFGIIQSVTVKLAGDEYPLLFEQVILFALASTLITVTSTFGQIISSMGINGARWSLLLTILSGGTNLLLSWWLIPIYGITGAVWALIGNHVLTLTAAYFAGLRLLRLEREAAAAELL